VFRLIKRLFLLVIVLTVLSAGGIATWVLSPIKLASTDVDIAIDPQTSVREIAQICVDSGVQTHAELLYAFLRFSGQSRKLRAGSYELTQGNTPLDLLRKLTRGEESLKAVTLIEGWTFKQFKSALSKAEGLKHDTQGLSDEALMTALGMSGVAPEGRFFPDTYTYGRGTSDLRVLQRAAKAMNKHLARVWEDRLPDLGVQTPEEALILASIVEKETGRESDRTMISSVFNNRLRIGMPLQTDPSVIYGMGDAFDGNLHKSDLLTDTPWNTYTRKGLPPTPIAMPGRNALTAAVHPARSQALYFVARGDGTSQFSNTLDDHNAAVNQYQRRIQAK
jgi:UPF0755 protein